MRTRGDVLAGAISFALIRARKVVRGLSQGLTEEDRRAVAESTVSEMKKFGDPWRLADEWEAIPHEGYCPPDWCQKK
jgi:hypothetical protein